MRSMGAAVAAAAVAEGLASGALTTDEMIQIFGLIVTGAGVLIAMVAIVVNAWQFRQTSKREQPIVIAHEARGRTFGSSASGGWQVEAFVTNEGPYAAYDVRFGVEMGGVRIPYKLKSEDPDRGNRQPVLRPGGQIPPDGVWHVDIPHQAIIRGQGNPDTGRRYWARYRNALGETWETLNPADRTEDLVIQRVRWVKRAEQREANERARALKDFELVMQNIVDETREMRDQAARGVADDADE